MAKDSKPAEPEAPVAVVDDEAKQKAARWEEEFQRRFGYENIKALKPLLPRLKYHDVVYVDNDGQEYKGRLSPIPWNKVKEAEVPAVADFSAEMERVTKLPLEQQAAAHAELMGRAGRTCKAILANGKYTRLFEAKPGVWLRTVPRNVGTGPTAKTIDVPVGNLIVDFAPSHKETPDFRSVEGVMLIGHVPTPAYGQRGPSHFKLA